MTSYLVTWEIDVEAEDEIDAAYEAREIMQDKTSEALSFIVRSVMNTVGVDVSSTTLKTVDRSAGYGTYTAAFKTVDVDLYKLKHEKEE